MDRPRFEDINSFEEFDKYYWYREEVQAICKSLDLEYDGNKSELKEILKAYFNGVIVPHKAKMKVKPQSAELTLEMGLIECGFTFGNKHREFFARVTGDDKFKYTADMVATVKAVKEAGDMSFTLRDLLDVKLGKREYAKYDTSSCQWNKFLKGFCADEYNNIYPDKLKTASRFWKLLRNSDLPKIYTREFIENNKYRIDD